jgi:hypothetical protein
VVKPVVLDFLTSVASVAKGPIVGLLAITKPHLFCFWGYILHWTGLDQLSHI